MTLSANQQSFSLKQHVAQRILSDVIQLKENGNNRPSTSKLEWRVLIVDELSKRMLSTCLKMHQLSTEGVTIVESVHRKREPMPQMEAIYLLTPTEKSVNCLIEDFKEYSMYKCAHVFFIEVCPESLYDRIKGEAVARKIKTLKEIDISFLPIESQAYSLDKYNAMTIYYDENSKASRIPELERISEQLATLCSTLGEYPSIRYRADCEMNKELATLVQAKLDAYKSVEPTMGEGPEKGKSQLIILDRGFDLTSPLLHELTYQAMVYDLLDVKNDVLRVVDFAGQTKEIILDENDDMWTEMRHQHISAVAEKVQKKLQEFKEKSPRNTSDANVKDLSKIVKALPKYQKDMAAIAKHLNLVEQCMGKYKTFVETLCKAEQDIAMGVDSLGEKIRDPMQRISSILLDQKLDIWDKIRVIFLFIQAKNGITKASLSKIFQHAQVSKDDQNALENFFKLDSNERFELLGKKASRDIPRRDRSEVQTFETSRWTPLLKDILEDCIDNNLDTNLFPFHQSRRQQRGLTQGPTSNRFGNWHKEIENPRKHVPRIIVFIMGGFTYSETRVGYEVTNERGNWEVIVGGSHPITPTSFLENVKAIPTPIV